MATIAGSLHDEYEKLLAYTRKVEIENAELKRRAAELTASSALSASSQSGQVTDAMALSAQRAYNSNWGVRDPVSRMRIAVEAALAQQGTSRRQHEGEGDVLVGINWENMRFIKRVMSSNDAPVQDRADAYWMFRELFEQLHIACRSTSSEPPHED